MPDSSTRFLLWMIPPIAATAPRRAHGRAYSRIPLVPVRQRRSRNPFRCLPSHTRDIRQRAHRCTSSSIRTPETAGGSTARTRGRNQFLGTQQRIKVLASCTIANLQQALEMIDARTPDVDLLVGQPHDARDGALSHEDAVAKAKRPDRAVFAKREDDAAFGI